MGRHFDATGSSDSSGLQPAGDAPNPRHVGHDIIAGGHLHCLLYGFRSVEVFPKLDGRLQVPRYCLIALILIVANWLFNPKEAAVIQCSTTVYCLGRTDTISG